MNSRPIESERIRTRMMNDAMITISDALRSAQSILISVHKNPDGDALGSQLALRSALVSLGKKVKVHNLDPVPDIYLFLPGAKDITTGPDISESFDAMVVLDAEPARTGLFHGKYPARMLINIDHHITNPREWPLLWLDEEAAATGEMIYRLVLHMGVPLNSDMALCLYTAILTDTGSFRYSNTSPAVLRTGAALLEHGVDPWSVTEKVYESYSFNRMKLLGQVLAGIERNADGTIAWIVITDALYRSTDTSAEDTENFVNFVRSIRGVEVAVLFRQTADHQYKISLRSKGRIDLSGLAKSLGGGGHRNAAGCTMEGYLEGVKQRVVEAIERMILSQQDATVR